MVSRFESCKDEKTAVGASFLSAILMAAMAVFPTILGLAALSMKDELGLTPDKANTAMMAVTNHHAPAVITGIVSASIIAATMSSADSNLLCMSTILMNDIFTKIDPNLKKAPDKKVIFYTRLCNVVCAVVATLIALGNVNIVTMNTFAFAIRCAGPFAAYGLGMVVKKAVRASGIASIITGTIGVVIWQVLSGGNFYLGILPVVFGCGVGTLTFFLVNLIGWKMGAAPAPSAYPED